MPQENLNKIWNAGKYFEPESEENPKPTPAEIKLSTVKRKINVAKAFVPQQEDPFKQKVEAVLKGITEEPASAPDTAGEEEKSVPNDVAEVIVGTGQSEIGRNLAAGKSIRVEGDAGDWTGIHMSGGEIHIEGNAGYRTGRFMSGGEIYVKGDAGKWTGCYMSGGEIHVKGNTGIFTGESMSDGEIHVEGNAGHLAGESMSGGTLRIDGEVSSFDKTAFTPDNKGTIIWKGETIWKNGQIVEPGWTNLNVKEKIAK
jgi:formylmethanofuran dehydrogenase subunit C